MEMSKTIQNFLSLLVLLIVIAIGRSVYQSMSPRKDYKVYNDRMEQKKLQAEQDKRTAALRDFVDSGRCLTNTTGLPNANGIRVVAYYPCSWIEADLDKNAPTLLKKFLHEINDSLLVGVLVDISKYPSLLTTAEIEKLRTTDFLKFYAKDNGYKYISSKKTTLGKIKAAEVTVKEIKPNAIGMTSIHIFFYKNNLVTISYVVASTSEMHAQTMFNNYSNLFDRLIIKTEFLE